MNSNGGGGGSHSGTMHRQHQSMVQLAAAAGIFPPHQAMIPSMGLQQQNQSSYPLHPLAPHHPHPSLHHHPNHHHPAASIAGGVPMTPLGQGFPGGGMIPGGPFPPPFIPQQNLGGGNKTHNMMGGKRNQSISVGGPPKAVLGGPMKKKVPSLPVVVAAVQVVNQLGKKKVIVNLPKETIKVCERDGGGQDEHGGSDDEGDDDDDDHHRNDGVEEKVERQPWARDPLPVGAVPEQPEIEPPELTTIEAYPSDEWRHHIPPTVDVFLPGKVRFFRLISYIQSLNWEH